MEETYKAASDIHVLPSYVTIPGLGMIPVNAFVLKAREPVLVDTGYVLDSPAFLDALRAVIELRDLRWIWLTHTDFDHIGSLRQILEEAPEARVVTTFLGVGIMGLAQPLPLDRVHLLNPGQALDVGDRTLTAFKPPVFDNPSTTGFYESKSGALFSSDCFGAVLQAPAGDAAAIEPEALGRGQVLWATVDSPWLHNVDPGKFTRALGRIREMSPSMILCSHLPAARGMTEQLLANIARAPAADPFVGPDQAALRDMLASLAGTPA
jgi:flavorubredoxin